MESKKTSLQATAENKKGGFYEVSTYSIKG